MSRLLTIAVREYLAFVRTVGFWLSICLMPLGLLMAIFATSMSAHLAPAPRVAVVDLTGGGYVQVLTAALTTPTAATAPGAPGPAPSLPAVIVPAPGAPFADAAAAGRALRPYLSDEARLPGGGKLDDVAIVHGSAADPALDLWTRNIVEPGISARLDAALAGAVRRARLQAAGLTPERIAAIDAYRPQLAQFSPKSEGTRVSARDNLPSFVGLALGFVLYALTLTGAGILLNSIIEEKQTRILEVLLTSASVPEIIGGKILGAAAVTASALTVWAAAAGFGFFSRDPRLLADIAGVLLQHGLIFYFLLYFVGGYLMYATLFTTIGAFCETPRDAQTLLGPLMILLTVPIVFMGQAVTHPDAPILATLSWIPPFTPFLMAARAASGPPLWQIVGTAALMFATTGAELWIAGRAFRTGALASGRFDLRLLLAGVAGRGER
ncbi:MAG TPA: ABC transporter permease [Caulobacteraceae bacterium]|jgi:ABC-2 type transport system permease protein